MSSEFLVRVVLHEGEDLYETLHEEMAFQKFQRTINGKDGKTYELPHAEYYLSLDSVHDCEWVLKKAQCALNETISSTVNNCRYEVVVTKAVDIAWNGLNEVDKKPTIAGALLRKIAIAAK